MRGMAIFKPNRQATTVTGGEIRSGMVQGRPLDQVLIYGAGSSSTRETEQGRRKP
jgi:hypothetical protein